MTLIRTVGVVVIVGVNKPAAKFHECARRQGVEALIRALEPGFRDEEVEDFLRLKHGDARVLRLCILLCGRAALAPVALWYCVEAYGLLAGDRHDFCAAGVVGLEHAVEDALDERDFVGAVYCGHLRESVAGGVYEGEDFNSAVPLVGGATDFHVEGRDGIVDGVNVMLEVGAGYVAF